MNEFDKTDVETPEDRELIERAQRGDRDAVDRLFARHVPDVRAFIRLRLSPSIRVKESSSDLVQSVCHDLLVHLDSFTYRGESSFRRWFYTAALNKIREKERYFRAEKRDLRRESPAGTADRRLLQHYASFCTPSQELAAQEQIENVERAFDSLPEDQREVITLSRILGLPHREIAEQMGRSEVAVRSLLSRALVRLSAKLESNTPPPFSE